jgi:hypothetical protein
MSASEPVATLIQIIADRDAEIKKLLIMIDQLHTPVTEFYKGAGWQLIRKEQLDFYVEKAGGKDTFWTKKCQIVK